ncbi:hypothetical protein Tco_1535503 [Tanacetum coccineum]
MELDEHVPLYAPEPEYLEHHISSNDDIQAEDQPYAKDASPTAESPGYIADSDPIEDDIDADSIDYPDEPRTDDEDPEEDDDEDPEEDPSEEHDPEDEDEDPEEDPSEEHEPEDEDVKEDESSEDSDETKPFEENETATTPPPPKHRGARISVRPQTPMTASTQALIDASTTGPLPSPPLPLPSPPPINPTYDQAPLGHRATMIRMRDDIPEEDMPPRRRFVLTTPPPGCHVAESSVAAVARASRAADKTEDVGYVRALQASEHKMTTSIEEVKDIRLEIDVVRDQRTAYEIELQEVHQVYLSFEARNRALLARLETLETHMSRMEWQRQRAEDDAVRHIIRTQVLEAKARIDTVEDAGSSC